MRSSTGPPRLAGQLLHAQVAAPRLVVELPLGPGRDPGHGPHRGRRVVADGGLAREHEGAGAVEHGVGHVAHLGPGGRGRRHHRLQHLGGGDDGPGVAHPGADDPLLVVGDVLQGAADAEVAPGDHHAVGRGDHLVEGVDRLLGLDLGHEHGPVGADRVPHPLDVGRRAHERDRHRVDAGRAAPTSSRRRSSAVGVAIAGRPAGKLTPGRPRTAPPDVTRATTRPPPTMITGSWMPPSPRATVSPGSTWSTQLGVVDGDAAPVAGGLAVDGGDQLDGVALGQVDARPRGSRPPAPSGPGGRRGRRRCGPRPSAACRTRRMRSSVSSTGPWASDRRAMSMPAAIMARRTAGSSDAGPTVATILVRRSTAATLRCPQPGLVTAR